MNEEINSGLLIIGVSSTVLFDGETSTTELILLNLTSGDDFTLPVSDEQAGVLLAHLESTISEETNLGGNGVDKTPDAETFAKKIGLGGSGGKKVDSQEEADSTPQF
jgi:hypothetical protein